MKRWISYNLSIQILVQSFVLYLFTMTMLLQVVGMLRALEARGKIAELGLGRSAEREAGLRIVFHGHLALLPVNVHFLALLHHRPPSPAQLSESPLAVAPVGGTL